MHSLEIINSTNKQAVKREAAKTPISVDTYAALIIRYDSYVTKLKSRLDSYEKLLKEFIKDVDQRLHSTSSRVWTPPRELVQLTIEAEQLMEQEITP